MSKKVITAVVVTACIFLAIIWLIVTGYESRMKKNERLYIDLYSNLKYEFKILDLKYKEIKKEVDDQWNLIYIFSKTGKMEVLDDQ